MKSKRQEAEETEDWLLTSNRDEEDEEEVDDRLVCWYRHFGLLLTWSQISGAMRLMWAAKLGRWWAELCFCWCGLDEGLGMSEWLNEWMGEVYIVHAISGVWTRRANPRFPLSYATSLYPIFSFFAYLFFLVEENITISALGWYIFFLGWRHTSWFQQLLMQEYAYELWASGGLMVHIHTTVSLMFFWVEWNRTQCWIDE